MKKSWDAGPALNAAWAGAQAVIRMFPDSDVYHSWVAYAQGQALSLEKSL